MVIGLGALDLRWSRFWVAYKSVMAPFYIGKQRGHVKILMLDYRRSSDITLYDHMFSTYIMNDDSGIDCVNGGIFEMGLFYLAYRSSYTSMQAKSGLLDNHISRTNNCVYNFTLQHDLNV